MSTGDFKIRDGKMLMVRLGPMNGQVQVHREGHVAPCRRGIWAFPFPFHDAFFYHHIWERMLPKAFTYPKCPERDEENYDQKYQEWTDKCNAIDYEARDKKLREIMKSNPETKFWYGGGFYSYIKPHKNMADAEWYWYDSHREFIAVAKKHILYHYDGKMPIKYSSDHLQLFIPC